MAREEKIVAIRLWWDSLTIKLVGRSIGYQYLWRQTQPMRRMQTESMSIDLSNNYFIVKIYGREEYERALLDGPEMIRDNNLHVQRWKQNCREEKAEISSLPVWVRFPVLPVEYYTKRWLKKARNQIGRTISEFWRLQYEGLQDLCFGCERYGHRDATCPLKIDEKEGDGKESSQQSMKEARQYEEAPSIDEVVTGYDEWMVVQRNRLLLAKETSGSLGISSKISRLDLLEEIAVN